MKLIRKKAPFKVKTVVKYWRDAKFTVYANISESQHPDSWIPLAYDTYELELADNVEIKLPELTATDSIELASDEDSFTVTFAAHHPYEELDYLVIDHNLSEFSDLPEDVEPLPSFVLYADEDNVWGTDEAKYIAEEYGLSATYDAENTSWTVTVGGKALEQIRDLASKYRDNVFEIYSIVSDVKGFQSGFMHDGSYEMTKVKITVENIKTISLDKNEVILAIYDEVYQEITLTATIEPENATNKKVTWSSSNESVATVTQLDDGLRATVKAVGEGIAVITVTTEDGAKTAECNVTVIKVNEPVINKSQGKSYSTIQDAIDDAAAGDTIEVMAGIYRGNLEIDVEGLTLKASKPGTATIAPEGGFDYKNGYGGITILADGVTIDGFNIVQTAFHAMIHTRDSNNVTITNNSFKNDISGKKAQKGVEIGYGSADCGNIKVEGNQFINLSCGVYINQGSGITIDDNRFSILDKAAVVFDGTQPIEGVRVTNNRVSASNYLLYFLNNVGSVEVDNNSLTNTELANWGVYNTTKKCFFSDIQEAINTANPGDVIKVAPGTYHGYLTINKSLTLLGPNAGIPGYSADRGPEAVLTVPKNVNLENPEGNEDAVILVKASGVTIEGFRITGDNGNGKTNYAGCNIQAGFGIKALNEEGVMNDLTFINNRIDCFVCCGIYAGQGVKYIDDIDENIWFEKVNISGNFIQNIHDLRELGYGYGIYAECIEGSITDNVLRNSSGGIYVLPFYVGGGGEVKGNDVESYSFGITYFTGKNGVGSWTFKENTVKAIDSPVPEVINFWFGIGINNVASEAGPVYFENNTIDGSGTSGEYYMNSELYGIFIGADMEDDAKVIIQDNTITGVHFGARRESGNLNLDDILKNNIFPSGSVVIGDAILALKELGIEEGTVYNWEKWKSYDSIQEAVYEADNGNTIIVGPGIYHEYLTIDKPITLLGPNAGIPGYSEDRGAEAIITVPEDLYLENPEGRTDIVVITVKASDVTIDGFCITGDNGSGPPNYAGFNIQAGYGINAFKDGKMENLTVRNNIFDCFSVIGVATQRGSLALGVYGPIENVTITGNLVKDIYELRTTGYGYGIYLQGANGSITDNVVNNSRIGIMLEPYTAKGEVFVKNNSVEAYRNGIQFNNVGSGAGPLIIEGNTINAIDPPESIKGPCGWYGISIQSLNAQAEPVFFIENTVDGSGTSDTNPNRAEIVGVNIGLNVTNNAEMKFEKNTITGVQIGLRRAGGNLNLDEVLSDNIFDFGSRVVGNMILVPPENTIYNVEKIEYYDSIQDAIDDAEDGDTIFVGPGTYEEDLIIPSDKGNLTLKGANVGVPAGKEAGERAPESIIVGSITVGSGESSGGDEDRTVSGLTIDGFTIDAKGECGISLRATGETTISNNIIKGNGVMRHGIRTQDLGNPHFNILNNTIMEYSTDYYDTDAGSAAILIRGSNATAYINGNLIQGADSYWDNYAAGIRIDKGAKANIVDNSIFGNESGIVLSSSENIVTGNLIENNYWGIYMLESDSSITDNTIRGNHIGVEADNDSYNTVTFNRIYGNHWLGVRAGSEESFLSATHNWWGVSKADEVLAQLDGYVEFNPWYVDEEMTKLCDEAAVEALNNAKDEAEFYELLREHEIALLLDFYDFDNELTEYARLQVILSMFGEEYQDADSVRYAFYNAVWEQMLLIPINTASNKEEMCQALDDNGFQLGLDLDYFDWTDYYRIQVAEYILEKRPQRGYENGDALKKVFEEKAQFLAPEANAVTTINYARDWAEMMEVLEDEDITARLDLDMSEYLTLSDLQKKIVAAILIDERPDSGYENKEAIKEAFELAVAEVKDKSVTDLQELFGEEFEEEQTEEFVNEKAEGEIDKEKDSEFMDENPAQKGSEEESIDDDFDKKQDEDNFNETSEDSNLDEQQSNEQRPSEEINENQYSEHDGEIEKVDAGNYTVNSNEEQHEGFYEKEGNESLIDNPD